MQCWHYTLSIRRFDPEISGYIYQLNQRNKNDVCYNTTINLAVINGFLTGSIDTDNIQIVVAKRVLFAATDATINHDDTTT